MAKENDNIEIAIAEVKKDVEYLVKSVDDMKVGDRARKEYMDETFVTRKEFEPIKRLAYGLVGTVLVTVVTAVLGYVITR